MHPRETSYNGNRTEEKDASAYLNRFGLSAALSPLLVYPYRLRIAQGSREEPIPQEVAANILSMLFEQHGFPLAPILFPDGEDGCEVLLLAQPSLPDEKRRALCLDTAHAFRDVCAADAVLETAGPAQPLLAFARAPGVPDARSRLDDESYLLATARQHLIILNTASEPEEVCASLTELFHLITKGDSEEERRRRARQLLAVLCGLVEPQLPNFTSLFASSSPKEEAASFDEWYAGELRRFCACMKQERRTHDSIVELVQSIIRSRISENVSLQQVADQVFISPNYLSRLFKEETGENFSEFTIRVKMEKAAELLRDPTCRVYEVNELLGYRSLQHFYKLFKRVFDCTPTEYREKILRVGTQESHEKV